MPLLLSKMIGLYIMLEHINTYIYRHICQSIEIHQNALEIIQKYKQQQIKTTLHRKLHRQGSCFCIFEITFLIRDKLNLLPKITDNKLILIELLLTRTILFVHVLVYQILQLVCLLLKFRHHLQIIREQLLLWQSSFHE